MDPFHHVRDGSTWELPRFVLDMFGLREQPVLPFGLSKPGSNLKAWSPAIEVAAVTLPESGLSDQIERRAA